MAQWHAVAPVERFQPDCGWAALVDGRQVAVFNFGLREWYATQNECPHMRQMVLARGILGDKDGEPKVACPLHKNAFSLRDGRHLGAHQDWKLQTYPVRVNQGVVEVEF